MGRRKFKIDTAMDSMNMHHYLCAHEQTIKNEFYESSDVDFDDNFEDLLLVLHDIANEEEYADSMFRSLQTELLYLLCRERINKIRTTLRAKRSSGHKSKKQLTIDSSVYQELKKYSEEHDLTLSNAIKSLLDNYYGAYS